MTIQEQLNAINETFVKLHKDFVRFEAEKNLFPADLLWNTPAFRKNGIKSVNAFLL